MTNEEHADNDGHAEHNQINEDYENALNDAN